MLIGRLDFPSLETIFQCERPNSQFWSEIINRAENAFTLASDLDYFRASLNGPVWTLPYRALLRNLQTLDTPHPPKKRKKGKKERKRKRKKERNRGHCRLRQGRVINERWPLNITVHSLFVWVLSARAAQCWHHLFARQYPGVLLPTL